MSIVQIEPFDILTASPQQMMMTDGFWSSISRFLSDRNSSARLLMFTDTVEPKQVLDGFKSKAVPYENLDKFPLVKAYRAKYEEFLSFQVQEVRYIRLYLHVESSLDDEGLARLLSTYGVIARPLDHKLPQPFKSGKNGWREIDAEDGTCWALLKSKTNQMGSVFPRTFHNLFNQPMPMYCCLDIYTYPPREALKTLKEKSLEAKYSPRKTIDEITEANDVERGIKIYRRDVTSYGKALHSVRFYCLVGAGDKKELSTRIELVRGSFPLEMDLVSPPGPEVAKVFGLQKSVDTNGTPMTSSGVALLVGSALSFRRPTKTDGIMLGVDRNQGAVVMDIFDERNPSYNTVILGQTGSGKTFAAQLLMLRQMLLGTRLVIVDPQGNIDLSFMGDVYQKSVIGTQGSSINVMDVVHGDIGTQVDAVVNTLTMLGVLNTGDAIERAIIDEALMSLYGQFWSASYGIWNESALNQALLAAKNKARDDTRVPYPCLKDVQILMTRIANNAVLPRVKNAANELSYKLSPYVVGSRASLFGQYTTVDFALNHPINVYDVSRLPQQEMGGNLRTALLAILVSDINQGIRSKRLKEKEEREAAVKSGRPAAKPNPILFFVDEMGILMRDSVVASHVSAEYKTARARYVGMIVADQDLHSLLGPKDEHGIHHGVPILANSANSLIFMQKDSERAAIREHFPAIPGSVVDSLPQFQRGVCAASLPDDLLIVDVLASRFEGTVLSSRLQDREKAMVITKEIREQAEAIF
ncbi:MAG: hypothetical protein AB9888_00185 [Bacteroidales bacterium]